MKLSSALHPSLQRNSPSPETTFWVLSPNIPQAASPDYNFLGLAANGTRRPKEEGFGQTQHPETSYKMNNEVYMQIPQKMKLSLTYIGPIVRQEVYNNHNYKFEDALGNQKRLHYFISAHAVRRRPSVG